MYDINCHNLSSSYDLLCHGYHVSSWKSIFTSYSDNCFMMFLFLCMDSASSPWVSILMCQCMELYWSFFLGLTIFQCWYFIILSEVCHFIVVFKSLLGLILIYSEIFHISFLVVKSLVFLQNTEQMTIYSWKLSRWLS